MSSHRTTVLFVDDEERILRSLKMLFRSSYDILTTTDGNQALELVRRQRVDVVVSDQRMPIMAGIDLLRSVKEISPDTLRILLTGYSDLAAIVGSVNEGEIFRYISKPWVADEMKKTIAEAVEIAQSLQQICDQQPDSPRSADILVIDSDATTARMVRSVAGGHTLHWSSDLDTAFTLLERENIGVVISELKDRGEDYADAIKQLKQLNPSIVTIITTAHRDGASIIGLINEGQVYRYQPKPVRMGLLGKNIEAAMHHHLRMRANPALVKRHRVQPLNPPTPPKFSDKVLSYFKKLRNAAA